MSEYLPKLDVTLMFGVGAAFDFLAGKVRQAPALDAAVRAGMVLSPLFRATAVVEALFQEQSAFYRSNFLSDYRVKKISPA